MAKQNVIVSMEDAKFALESLKGLYEMVKEGLTRSRREPYTRAIAALEATIARSNGYDSYSYFHEQLEELDDDY